MSAPVEPNAIVAECGSTNDLARAFGEQGHPHGTWISARSQTAGRGRHGRSWVSEPGNLFLSLILRDVPRDRWTWVPLAAALGARDALNELRAPAAAPVLIKWPNDLWIGGAKAGGILCEAVNGSSNPFLIVGIGINCVTRPHITDAGAPEVACADVSADALRPRVIKAVIQRAESLRDPEGARQTARDYENAAELPSGTEIEWGTPEQRERGLVVGLGEWGELRVMHSSGEERRLMAEDVRATRFRASR